MNKIDEIRAKLGANDILSAGAIDEIIRIITPYLSHGITEEEAFNCIAKALKDCDEKWCDVDESIMQNFRDCGLITSSQSNQEHGITEEEARMLSKWLSINKRVFAEGPEEYIIRALNAHNLITSSREPIAKPENNSQINNWCKERDEILGLCVESDSNFARKVFNFCGMSSDLISCLKTEMDTNKLRQPIAEPESLVKAREAYHKYKEMNFLESKGSINYIRELEARVKELEGK